MTELFLAVLDRSVIGWLCHPRHFAHPHPVSLFTEAFFLPALDDRISRADPADRSGQ